MLDLVIPSPCILIYQILPFVSTFHWPVFGIVSCNVLRSVKPPRKWEDKQRM
ncbi:hypothetical protein JHK82_026988 [Glycine max]|uniref:Uncharacterized protein n=2 Tax=Glycine subgen. Soja TaxID=1462606 RepID=K7LHK9_SOYBN|nr:hypothetical protein JHK87_026868 [Glycine soja]KAG4996173.1 hypothetical protein JHK85_027612 [Glycine max]KAG5002974.1 hypothetical protein JHK86_027113 [Glycine max]KAG5126153.1 hypothetical protein JHK82_026988 [Glycine max]KAG5150747.1 hypothetical protein JHK84_027219 [Glycine max]